MDNKSKGKIKPVSYRLPEKIKTLITILAQKLMVSKTAIVTLAILNFAKKENVEVDDENYQITQD
jgi:predicted transcriptional regulator